MASNMRLKFDKYWGSLDKMNKVLFLAIVLDPRYKLDYVSFCFISIYGDEGARIMTDEVKVSLIKLYEFYKTSEFKLTDEINVKTTHKMP